MKQVKLCVNSIHCNSLSPPLFPIAMASEEQFCENYLVLKPEEASWIDLISLLLFSSKLGKRRFFDSPEEHKERNLEHRWLILISIVVQKLLLLFAKPMAHIGHVIEMWLNLLSNNGGLLMLLTNFLKGKVVKPDRSSATFTSILGNLDTRIELDRRIKPDNRKYNASLSMMAAKLSYENEAFIKTTVKDKWKMEFLGLFNFWNDYQERLSTQAFIFQDANPNLIVIAFRGTEPFDADEWRTDVDISWYGLKNVGKIHSGFMKALGLQKNKGWPKEIEQGGDQKPYAYYAIRQMLREMLQKNEEAKFVLTGHSLGAALAILFEAVLVLHEETWLLDKLEGVYTFGQPRVGDKEFGEYMVKNLIKYDVKYLRYAYCNDMITRLPFDDQTQLFKHFGPCLYYNSCYKGKVVREEPNKNYFSILWFTPKILNAVWELIRSFIIPYIKGRDYKEGWLLRLLRVIGLVIPGLSAHAPQDYVNATRLGTLPESLQLQELIYVQDLKRD